jgi:3-phenylpropionate/trans-cinnamate dioxygenase ferredoxin component
MGDEFVKVATVAEIPPESVKVVEVGGTRVVVCNEEGSFYAVADLCTHDYGPLGQGELFDGQIECPRHGATFDIKTGKATRLPAITAIDTYPVEVRGEEIWVGVKAR